MRATTVNDLHGRTFNPWNDWATSGGSSGGASSAVMGGMGAIAHGNDIAGSVRYPAAAVGAATVKPGLGPHARLQPLRPGGALDLGAADVACRVSSRAMSKMSGWGMRALTRNTTRTIRGWRRSRLTDPRSTGPRRWASRATCRAVGMSTETAGRA